MTDNSDDAVAGTDTSTLKPTHTRRFELVRDQDPTGVSGTGVVAVGVEFPTGAVVIEWHAGGSDLEADNGLAIKPGPNGIADLLEVHGHGGRTRLHWLDYPSQTETESEGGEGGDSE